jgi:hypothetical protein
MQTDTRLTMTGDLVGTLRYMSPEQALAKRVVIDHRTDVYSLGATLYELLTLEPPFTGSDRQELLRQIAFEEPRPPRRLNRAIPTELETIVLKALEKNPADRYATAQELADDLRRFQEHKPIRAKRPTLTERVRTWVARQPAVVGLLLVSGLAALALGGVVVSLVYSAQLEVAKTNAEEAQQRLLVYSAQLEVAKTNAEEAQQRLEALQYRHYIDRAQAGLQYGNLGPVEDLLKACPVEQRRWEWLYLKRQCHAELLTFKSMSVVSAVSINGKAVLSAVSPDGTRCAFAGKDGTVKICDTTTAQEIRTLPSPNARPGGNGLELRGDHLQPRRGPARFGLQ